MKSNDKNNNKIKMPFGTRLHSDVIDAIQVEARKRGCTISGLVETILVNWLNENKGTKHKVKTDSISRTGHGAYALGQIAAKEYEIIGKVRFEEYLFDTPGKKLTALKKKLVSLYRFTQDVGELFDKIPQAFYQIPMNRRHYIRFFAGFCGIDWNIADKEQ